VDTAMFRRTTSQERYYPCTGNEEVPVAELAASLLSMPQQALTKVIEAEK
jgi:hypothetical protein